MYYKAISNGNADTLGVWETWNGSAWVAAASLPSTSDDVYTNNFIVTVTTSQAYNSWNRSSVGAPYNITQGGQFQIDGANEITLTGQANGTNGSQSAASPLSACINRLSTHTNTLHRVGDDVGGSSNSCYGFWNASTHDIDLVGNQQGGIGAACYGFYNNGAATFTSIVGDQQGGSGSASYGFYNNAASTFTSIIGNQNGGGYYGYGFYNYAASTFTSIVGNQQGGSGTSSYGFYNYAAAIFSNPIVGNQIANAVSGFYNNAANINIPFQGNAYASGVAAIYNNQATSTIIYEGNQYNNLAVMAIRSDRLFLNVTPTTVWEFSDFDGDTQYLYGAGVNTGHPIEADVRKDTVYGPSSEFTGTLVVPPASSVVKDVPVDNTVGTWQFDEPLVNRLKNCATTAMVGQIVASYNAAPVEIIPNAEKRHDYTGTTSFCGTAVQGTLESSPTWNLTKIVVNENGTSTTTVSVNSWENRYIATYS